MKKSARVMTVLILLLTTGFVGVSLTSYFVARKGLTDQILTQTIPLTSVSIFSQIRRDLTEPILISSIMAQDTFVHEWIHGGEKNAQRMIRFLTEIEKKNGAATAFFVSEKSRRYFHTTGVLKTVREEDPQDAWFFRARDMAEDYEVNVDIDTKDLQSLTVFINHKVSDRHGRFLGLIGVGLAVSSIKEMIEDYYQSLGMNVLFVDQKGAIKLSGPTFADYASIYDVEGLARHADDILSTDETLLTYDRDGVTSHIGARLIPEFGWYLLVDRQDDAMSFRLIMPLLGNLLIGLTMTVLIGFLAYGVLHRFQGRLEAMATTDRLTGLLNRHAFDAVADHFMKLARRQNKTFSALMLDIDRFKQVNDQYGHPAGDEILRQIVQVIQKVLRESDATFRWGGEEFLVLLRDCSQIEAKQIADKIRGSVEQHSVTFAGNSLSITISVGVSEWRETDTIDEVVKRADTALINAKENGRNTVVGSA